MTSNLLCPNCHQRINPDSLACSTGHQFTYQDGVLVLLEENFKRQLQAFMTAFSAIREAEGKRLLDKSAYEKLPYGQKHFEWRFRAYDLAIVRRLLGKRERQRILDIGAWNGWLSHCLAVRGHNVTAIDYFIDEYDGLAAKKFYSTAWQAIQMDLRDLWILDQPYDVVILNRCLQFFADPVSYIPTLQQKVVSGGLLILTGLGFSQDPVQKARDVAALRAHLNRYNLDFFKPMKGYLDFVDKTHLEAQDIVLCLYPQLWLANLKSMLNKKSPRYYYGFYEKQLG